MNNALRPRCSHAYTRSYTPASRKAWYAHSRKLPKHRSFPKSPLLRPNAPKSRTRLYKRVLLGAAAAYLASTWGSYQYMKSKAPDSLQTPLVVPEDTSDRYNEIAQGFDSEINFLEITMGIGWLRSWLVRKASGNVLEVSAGTGRNSRYFDVRKCKTITLLDQSQAMIEIARQKFKDAHPRYKACRFITQSTHAPIVEPPGKFDTILQTMGLCSTANPAQTLQHLGTLVNSNGRILLLEHGRSYYGWLNRMLDASAPRHADKYGCWWNKDIDQIVEESGLEILKAKRYHFGTTYWFELRPRQN